MKNKISKKESDKLRQVNSRILYKTYIKSEEWKEKRRMVFKYYKHCCRCESTNKLCVHHGSYRRVSEERPSDLYLLCGECHQKFHKRFPLKENMKRNTLLFIREKNKNFQPRHCMPMQEVANRESKRHCKYCNGELRIKKDNRKPKGKGKYYYVKTWECAKRCTHAVCYYFDEDKVYKDISLIS